jgi:hypothetical protein
MYHTKEVKDGLATRTFIPQLYSTGIYGLKAYTN